MKRQLCQWQQQQHLPVCRQDSVHLHLSKTLAPSQNSMVPRHQVQTLAHYLSTKKNIHAVIASLRLNKNVHFVLQYKTRRVAVCLETHCNIGSITMCWRLASDVEASHLISFTSSLTLCECAVRLQTFAGWHSSYELLLIIAFYYWLSR